MNFKYKNSSTNVSNIVIIVFLPLRQLYSYFYTNFDVWSLREISFDIIIFANVLISAASNALTRKQLLSLSLNPLACQTVFFLFFFSSLENYWFENARARGLWMARILLFSVESGHRCQCQRQQPSMCRDALGQVSPPPPPPPTPFTQHHVFILTLTLSSPFQKEATALLVGFFFFPRTQWRLIDPIHWDDEIFLALL